MNHCPSQDWDRHNDDQDRQMAAEAEFYRRNKAAILAIVRSLVGNQDFYRSTYDVFRATLEDEVGRDASQDGPRLRHAIARALTDQAAAFVREVEERGEMP